MMKTAFAYWDNRIAPVFDTARQIFVIEREADGIISETRETLVDGMEVRKALHLAQLNIATLVCGAISRPLYDMVMANGIEVIPFVAGELGDVVRAWLDGRLDHDSFTMPGCCRRRWFDRRVPCCEADEGQRMRRGNGERQVRGQGRRRTGDLLVGDLTGFRICATCGHREPHTRGVPCVQKQCPKCGAVLTRE